MYKLLQITGRGSSRGHKGYGIKATHKSPIRWASQLSTAYKPTEVEQGKLERKYVSPNMKGKCKPATYRMLLPPPNVTGSLHLGHTLMATIQDVISRQKRQMGYDVLWIPGTDHAGIATQVVVEKKLLKERGVSRHQIGREEFLKEVWKWKQEKGAGIVDDLMKLGCTLSWDREYFTMDERQAYAVNEAFIRLFDEGLIQRKESLVNWSCALQSAISDIEVETIDLKGPTELPVPGYDKNITFGRIYDINYKVMNAGNHEYIKVSTTRPETLLGDVAVAVNPTDERYQKYRNMPEVLLWHPFREEPIPLVFDVTVEPEFGTGAVKITPAHDRNDFDIARRHLLKPLQVFSEKGLIKDEFNVFANSPRFEAREQILQKLAEMQLLQGVHDHAMQLPICSRSKDVIEYMLREQWFLHCQSMADEALAEVLSGRLQIVPPNFEIEWQRWLENCHDWCISRQLWWGHQIPAYKATNSNNGETIWVAAHTEQEALLKSEEQLQTSNIKLTRDSDVLDTWFSSALLPFSASNWPSENYKQHYPLDLMETGHDILFFWVARMVMLGLKLTGSAPFKKILLNGIVCDAHGRKMSKSLGNVVTPQQVVKGASLESLQQDLHSAHKAGVLSEEEVKKSLKGLQRMFPQGIQECGTDSLRFTLCSHNIKNHFINFDVNECYTNKLFLNKIWQATRFTLGSAERLNMPLHEIETMNQVPLTKWDLWILSRMADTLRICNENFENYNFHVATGALKNFLYNNLCDVYVETCKRNINLQKPEGYIHCATLATVLSWCLQAMWPFTPFVTEELLKHLPCNIDIDLNKYHNVELEKEISQILDICQQIRQLKSRNTISKKHDPHLYLYGHSNNACEVLRPYLNEIQALTLTTDIHLHTIEEKTKQQDQLKVFSTAGHLCSFGISTNDSYKIQKDTSASVQNLNEQKLQKLQTDLQRYRMRMENEGFRRSASQDVQQKHAEKIQQLEVEIEKIKSLRS
ncbi:valyl-tRNA synthetase, mitochondrial [Haematobia irritans]|uniref:valyl-tRNA synthetase, mitochondrial n=1 Tax=Haematobia irritans TaxID=7368 RepID=UPI003F4F4D58